MSSEVGRAVTGWRQSNTMTAVRVKHINNKITVILSIKTYIVILLHV